MLYVPGLQTNLLSIAAATDAGWTATFTASRVEFTSKEEGITMVGERVGKTIYLLAISPRRSSEQQSDGAFSSSLSTSLATWHKLLAHTGYKNILRMASDGAVRGLDVISKDIPTDPFLGCEYGKSQRLPFPTGHKRATYAGEMIQSDLCGPMQKATSRGKLYYAIFVDEDFSGYRLIRFLKQKSEAAQCFMELFNVVRGETGNLVRVLRTDGGG